MTQNTAGAAEPTPVNLAAHPLHDAIRANRQAVRDFIERAAALDARLWTAPRAPGKWAPAQEVAHVALTYAAYVTELDRGPPVTTETFQPRHAELRERALPRILQGGWFPSGADTPRSARPPDTAEPSVIALAALGEHIASFERALIAAHERDPDRHVRHPYFGALSLDALIRVLLEHTRHHTRFLP